MSVLEQEGKLSQKLQKAAQELDDLWDKRTDGDAEEVDALWVSGFRELTKQVLDDLRYTEVGYKGDGRAGNGWRPKKTDDVPDEARPRHEKNIFIRTVDMAYFYAVSLRRGEFKRWTMGRALLEDGKPSFGLQRICIPLRYVRGSSKGVFYRERDKKFEPSWIMHTCDLGKGLSPGTYEILPNERTHTSIYWHCRMQLTDGAQKASKRVFQRITDIVKFWEISDNPKKIEEHKTFLR